MNQEASILPVTSMTSQAPLHNSIPPELLPQQDPIYVVYYNAFNTWRLHTPEILIEEFRKNPAQQKCPVDGLEITIRIFEPAPQLDDQGQPKSRAANVNFHGGGWMFGGLACDHDLCKRVVHGLDGELVALDVDYRLAPEHKYPIPVTIPVNNCLTAFNWIRTQKVTEFNLDSNRFTVGGASAGGHLSAVISHLCRNANIHLRLQIVTVSMEFAPVLPAARMAYFHRPFLGVPRPAESDEDWKISPILTPNFQNLAPALVSTAALDPLRDGEAYVAKLQAGGYL
ncbi:hypothetical protein PDIDSM_4486 [Penicillium digitatum]|nr:hypothetical protein PDIDSM_4486 [Penicillium digitatum]